MLTKFRILLVEDNHANVILMHEALRESSFPLELQVAKDGQEALTFLHGSGTVLLPDLVLLDINLPFLSGHDVLKAIRNNVRTAALPVIVMSSSGAGDDVQKAYELHGNSYVKKPLELDKVFRVMAAILEFWLITVRRPEHKAMEPTGREGKHETWPDSPLPQVS